MRADRLLSLMLMLGAGGRLTAQMIAEKLEVSERTVYRDIDALCSAGIPVYTQSGVNGGVFLDENYRISLEGFSRADLQLLFMSSDAGPMADLGLAKDETLLKLFSTLPAMQQREVERVRQRFFIDPSNWFQATETPSVFPMLQQAVWEDRVIQVRYQPVEGSAGERLLEAHALVAKATVWYLVGRAPGGGALHNFRASRFEQVTLTDQRFRRDDDLDLAAYWKASCEQFERFSAEHAPPFPALLRVHPNAFWFFPGYMNGRYEKLSEDADGWIRVRATFDSIDHARTQVLGFGTFAETLEPDELKQTVLETAEAIIKWHRERGGS